MDCIFCKIIKKEAHAQIVFENELVTAFKDIKPDAPIHFLIVPNIHIATLNDTNPKHSKFLSEILLTAKILAEQNQVLENSYRLVFNTNKLACQSVFHIHAHFLANRSFKWPPG